MPEQQSAVLLNKEKSGKMPFEEAIIQGITQGGVSALSIFLTVKYILPRLDRQTELLVKIDTKITKKRR